MLSIRCIWTNLRTVNFINASNPDVSGTFKFVIDELQAAEDAGERVWIVAHVLSGNSRKSSPINTEH